MNARVACRWIGLWLFASTLWIGCSKPASTGVAHGAPAFPTIDDDTLTRLMAAMGEMKSISRARLTAELGEQESAEGAHAHPPTGPGMSAAIGDDAIPIALRHGFASVAEFERTLSFAMMALQQLTLGDTGGLGQESKSYAIRAGLEEHRQRVAKIEQDAALSRDERTLQLAELRRQIALLEDQLAEDESAADAMREQFAALPAINLETMRKHRDEFLAAINPH